VKSRFASVHQVGSRPIVAALALVGLLAPALARPQLGAPIPWQEAGPAGRLFLQQPPDAPEPLEPGALGVELRLLYANTLVVAAGARTRVDVDLESAVSSLTVRAGLAPGLELSATLPVVADAGGVFDGFIEGVERVFRSENFQRGGRPRGLVHYELGPAAGGGLSRQGSASDVGDAWAGLKWLAWQGAGARATLALRAAVKAPTGGPTFGSGTWDVGAGVLAGWRWPSAALRLSLDGAVPGGRLAGADLATRPYGAASLGLAVRATAWLTMHGQLSTHLSPLDRTGVPQLDKPIFDAALGVAFALAPGSELLVAGVENFASPRRGADAAFLVALRVASNGPIGAEAGPQQPAGGSVESPSLAAAPSRGR